MVVGPLFSLNAAKGLDPVSIKVMQFGELPNLLSGERVLFEILKKMNMNAQG
jgi:hypothetical protein